MAVGRLAASRMVTTMVGIGLGLVGLLCGGVLVWAATEGAEGLGRHRWRVERSLSWLSCFRRLQVRWDRDDGRWFAFVLLACALVCFNRL